MTLLSGCAFASAQQIPAGTVLPVMLSSSVDARHLKPGETIAGKLMQDVALPDGWKIRHGSTVSGKIVEVDAGGAASPSTVELSFTRLRSGKREIPISVELRALASPGQVFEARLPTNAIDDYGTSTSDWNTIQVGGAGVYRGSGEVVQDGSVVGRATDYGAVTAKLMPSPEAGCSHAGDREQALWVFSPAACGTYGYPDLKVVRRGKGDGVIELQSPGNLHIGGGSGWLLKTNAP